MNHVLMVKQKTYLEEEGLTKILWHVVVPWKSRKVKPKSLNFSDSVITEKPKDLVQVSRTLETAGKTSLFTPNSVRICKKIKKKLDSIISISLNDK